MQLIFASIAVALALVMPEIDAGPDIENSRIESLMVSLAGAIIAVIAVVFSLLFLVVPYANTSLTPRLTLFRDNPIVWRSFAFFVAVFVFFAVSGMALTNDEEVSVLVPAIALLLVFAALTVIRTLQFRAYRSLQLGATLTDITEQGERVLDVLYVDEFTGSRGDPASLPPLVAEVRWRHGLCVIDQVDVPRLVRWAERHDAVVQLMVAVGEELRRGEVVFAVRADGHWWDGTDPADLLPMLEVGPDRTFDQDPLFAFRLLVDIALRALSSAINDPISAAQAIGGIHEMLDQVAARNLDNGNIGGADGALRVVLRTPTWEDYLAIGVDELTPYVEHLPQARRRLEAMIDSLLASAPPDRRPALKSRQQVVAALNGATILSPTPPARSAPA